MTSLKCSGRCSFCKQEFSSNMIGRHIQTCSARSKKISSEKGEESIFLFKASAEPYWVYFEVPASQKLEELDGFLRDLWLECCGHLSCFIINGTRYESHEVDMMEGDKTMEVTLGKAMGVGTSFVHQYDYGTTTQLTLKCLAERKGKAPKKIEPIAQNNPPEINCSNCKKEATDICAECAWDGKGLYCESCAGEHECGEEMLLPMVNSPRMGMCGYTG